MKHVTANPCEIRLHVGRTTPERAVNKVFEKVDQLPNSGTWNRRR